ncbi:acyl-CoA thioester hydrolase/BAAT C-terminal domain-containing protein [Halovivax gelatinilyticus]|uniref:acyl-CoA thioester hydrolase/BAAT C-terminal domain-containing protein n=1 Tax=Halovivax gelatinilyticus TaxID=2961597 RepID=UPI0020CA9707|nr:acyl-CoA thioester hydrolase/BAAT C-terminal domain-containing protein [Halovivax gelatinilyticus]
MDESFVAGSTIRTDGVTGRLFPGRGVGPHPGVLVLHGSGGARGYEQTYAAMLAEHGYTVLCVEYFGAPGVRDRFLEVPVEEFGRAAEWLLARDEVGGETVGVVGFSRGGEAALLVGSLFDAVEVVVAYVPSGYVWAAPSWMDGVGENRPTWTRDGDAVPYIPTDDFDAAEDPFDGEPSATVLALDRLPTDELARTRIPVAEIDGPVLLVSGGRDSLWPSEFLASRVAEWLAEAEYPWAFEHLRNPEAGHAIRVPYQFDDDVDPTERHRFGGTHEANARASARAWHRSLAYLDHLRH